VPDLDLRVGRTGKSQQLEGKHQPLKKKISRSATAQDQQLVADVAITAEQGSHGAWNSFSYQATRFWLAWSQP
jgi:hypothetical protein